MNTTGMVRLGNNLTAALVVARRAAGLSDLRAVRLDLGAQLGRLVHGGCDGVLERPATQALS